MSITQTRTRWLLISLLLTSSVFYFWQVSRPDVITDESSYATRAIGMVDFDFGIEQPTPWQWVDQVPWWMRLSFHDHPPLVFLIQHFSIKLFGENTFAIRLPSVLAGLVSIFLLYLIGKRLYSNEIGLIAASLFALTANHVWISRVGLQESILIALMLGAAHCFFSAISSIQNFQDLENLSISVRHPIDIDTKLVRRGNARTGWWFAASGALLGLAFLAKYLALILIPIFIAILLLRRRDLILSRYSLFSTLCFLVVASPVIIYNIELYRNFGHFDFQFSQFFNQDVKAWPSHPGQDSLGDTQNRIVRYFPWLVDANSPYFLFFALLGVLLMLREHWKSRYRLHRETLIVILLLLPFFVLAGPAYRFFTIFTPWLAIPAGYFISSIRHRFGSQVWKFGVVVALVLAVEFGYSINSLYLADSRGPRIWAYARAVRIETQFYGYNELERYFAEILEGKFPEIAITFDFPFAKRILETAVLDAQREKKEFVPWGIVYADGLNPSSVLWVFLRRITYQGWPISSLDAYKNGGGKAFYQSAGVKEIFFVNALEDDLTRAGIEPREILNPRGETSFRVYRSRLP